MPGFPKADRPTMVPPGTSDVGPGEYGPFRAACEPQVDSRKVTCGSIKFGTGYRKGNFPSHSLTYSLTHSLTHSLIHSSGGGLVKQDLSEPSPGPGSYTLPGGIATKAKGSPFRDSPTAIISGRNKFGSPW